jgi:hypothetical protein
MSLVTITASITNGKIIPEEPEKVPDTGRALVTILANGENNQNSPQRSVADLMGDVAGTGNGTFDFADACVLELANSDPNASICTVDQDFRVSRLNTGESIRLIAPF